MLEARDLLQQLVVHLQAKLVDGHEFILIFHSDEAQFLQDALRRGCIEHERQSRSSPNDEEHLIRRFFVNVEMMVIRYHHQSEGNPEGTAQT